ncbi:MAG: sensor histidine kinase [Limisphaerales bacterium]
MFWQTWSFRIASSASLIGLIGAAIHCRLLRERRRFEHQKAESLEQERVRIARDMHDHIGAHLAAVARAAGGNGHTDDWVRTTVRELTEMIWAIDPGNDNLPRLVDHLADFAQRYLTNAGVALDLDLPALVPPWPVPGGLRHQIAGMYKEALRNIIHHAGATRAEISLRIDPDPRCLTLKVRDNGRGFDMSRFQEGQGLRREEPSSAQGVRGGGINNLYVRSRELGGQCTISSTPPMGTLVEFVVPLNSSGRKTP